MSQWIGQLEEQPDVWFLVWAPTRRAAREMVTNDIGAVARGSIKQVNGPGYFLFRATFKKGPMAPLAELQPPEGEYLILYDPPSEEWILRKLSEAPVVAKRPLDGAGRSLDLSSKVKGKGAREFAVPVFERRPNVDLQ